MSSYSVTHLKQLEAESIHIFREVAAEFERPVLLYSIGKDSSVLVHLARKAFHPAPLPFPLLHVDTTWKFREMIEFRDRFCAELGLELIVHINPEGLRRGINPFDHGSNTHTDVGQGTRGAGTLAIGREKFSGRFQLYRQLSLSLVLDLDVLGRNDEALPLHLDPSVM